MKQQFRYLLTGIGSLAMLAFVGCTKPSEEGSIILSQQAGTLPAEVTTPLTIQVEAAQNWEAVADAAWLLPEKVDATTLTISAANNTENVGREGIVTVTAGKAVAYITINQLAYDSPLHYRDMANFQYDAAVSPSGNYVGGFIYSIDEASNGYYQPVIIETETDEWHYLEKFPQSLYNLTQTTAITDDGRLFIENANGGQVIFSQTEQPIVPDASSAGFSVLPVVTATASDCTTWAGYTYSDELYRPLVWKGGVAEELPWPEKNFRDEEFGSGIIPRGISADGSVIYGSTWDNQDFGMVYWKDGKVDYVGKDVRKVTEITIEAVTGTVKAHMVDGMIATAEYYKVSPNGEWIAGTFRTEVQSAPGVAPVFGDYTAAFYNTVEEKTYLVDGYATAISVTNDGIGFVSTTNMMVTTCNVYDIKNSTDLGNINDWVLKEYGYILPQNVYVQYVSPDTRTLFGRFMFDMNGTPMWRSWYLYNGAE